MRKKGLPWGKIQSVFLLVFFFAFSSKAGAFLLPDTGQTKCYSVKGPLKAIKCPAPGSSSAQDGSYTINAPSFTIYHDGTVLDNNTRLMWERYSEITTSQNSWSWRSWSWNDALARCENSDLGGHTDWRLPTKKELMTIYDFGLDPEIDPFVFPQSDIGFWTSTFSPISVDNVWVVTYTNPFEYSGYQPEYVFLSSYSVNSSGFPPLAGVRCVRGNSPSPFNAFVSNDNETITDKKTALTWKVIPADNLSWESALDYCEGLSLAGYSDWRLPNLKELESITDDQLYPPLNTSYFSPAASSRYWSSTTYTHQVPDRAWYVDFKDGSVWNTYKTANQAVRCVRGEKSRLDDGEITVNPSGVSFGIMGTKSSGSKTVSLSNGGRAAVQIGQIAVPLPPFSVSYDGCSGKQIPPSGSCSFTAVFSPEKDGLYKDDIVIETSDAENAHITMPLSGSTESRPPQLPDSGQTACYDLYGNDITCPPPGDPQAQDGSYVINPVSYSNNGDGTVTDDNTGLMWQQQDDGQQYTWYEASGTYDKKNNRKAASACGSLTLGGHADWRLPSLTELQSIVDYGGWNPSIDAFAFVNASPDNYWTSTADSGNTGNAWQVGFGGGGPYTDGKFANGRVRCVRGQSEATSLINNGDGTVTDGAAHLMWQQDAAPVSLFSATSYCEMLSLAGYDDWRLPNIRELVSLVDYTGVKPSFDQTFFPQDLSEYNELYFWSSTPYSGDHDKRLSLLLSSSDFVSGIISATSTDADSYCAGPCGKFVRCVRGGTGAPETPAALTGLVTDSSSGQPLSNVSVTVTDAVKTQSVTTGTSGAYTISGLTPGQFTATFQEQGYTTTSASDSVATGQTLTLDVQLSPGPPLELSITSPQDSAVINSSPALVSGKVSNNAQVTVNGVQADVSGDSFSVSVPLGDGQNIITATATNQYGQTTSQSITVTFILPKPPVISTITTTNISADSATITWMTDQPSDSLVEYGATTAYGSSASDAVFMTAHSIALTNLASGTTYHFRVSSKNIDGLSASSVDFTFTTSKFQATFLGDFGNVTVVEVKGNYNSNNPDGTLNYLPRQEIAKEFIKSHADEYDFMIVFSNFDFTMPQTEAKAYYLEVKNDVQGIGKLVFDDSAFYGSSRLQGIIEMGNLSGKVTDPADPGFEDTLATLAHEQMHRWGAGLRFRDSNGNLSNALLGKNGYHWSYLLDSDASAMYGNDWRDNKDGTFTSTGKEKYYGALDLYLAGFFDKSEVPPLLLIDNPAIDPARLPEVGTAIRGTARYVSIDDIIAAEGARIPNASTSQKSFKTAFILITQPGTFTGTELPGIENIRSGWAGRFAQLTGGKGSIADVAPNITIAVTSPLNGETITGPEVTVKGAVMNTTGNETGVTVNGVVATIYGNQFIVNHVPLMEGANTLTIAATDTAGNTASASVSVTAVAGDYIRLTSNIDSGISPLEVTLRIDGSFSIDNADLSVEGPTVAEIVDNPAPDEYTLKFNSEGLYYVTATVTGPDGKLYEDTITITLMNREQLDRLLKAKWDGMKAGMSEKNIEKAMSLFLSSSQERYRYIFSNLLDILPTIAANMRPIQMISMEGGMTECRIQRQETVGEVTYYIYFVLDEKGTWKIQQY